MSLKSWTKFKRKALTFDRLRRELTGYLERGEMPPMQRRWMLDKYGFRRIGGGAGLDSLVATIGSKFSWQAQVNLTGANYNPTSNQGSIVKNLNIGTAAANAAIGGSNEVFSYQVPIAGGNVTNTATVDLFAMTDLLQRASSAIVRIKGYQFRLLSGTDDSTLSPTPTLTSVGVVSNIGPGTAGLVAPAPLDFQNNGSGLTVTLTGAGAVTAVAVVAAGTGYPTGARFLATPLLGTTAGGCVFLAGVSSASAGTGAVSTAVFVSGCGGSGYVATTVPAVAVGQYALYTGGFHVYADPSPGGFCAISATSRNVLLQTTDPANKITFEVDIIGGTT